MKLGGIENLFNNKKEVPEIKKYTDAEKEQVNMIASDFLLKVNNSKLSFEQKSWLAQEVLVLKENCLKQLYRIDQDIELLTEQEVGGYGYSEYNSEQAKDILKLKVPEEVNNFQLKIEKLASVWNSLLQQEVTYKKKNSLAYLEKDSQYQNQYQNYSQLLRDNPKKFFQSNSFNFRIKDWDGLSLPNDLIRQEIKNVLDSKKLELEQGIENGQAIKAVEKLAILRVVSDWLDSLKLLDQRKDSLNSDEQNNEIFQLIDQEWLQLNQKYQRVKEYIHSKITEPDYLQEFDEALVEEYQVLDRKRIEKIKKINKAQQQEIKETLRSTELQERQNRLLEELQLLFSNFDGFLEEQIKGANFAEQSIEKERSAKVLVEQIESCETVESLISFLKSTNSIVLTDKEKIISEIEKLFWPGRLIKTELKLDGADKILKKIPEQLGLRSAVLKLIEQQNDGTTINIEDRQENEDGQTEKQILEFEAATEGKSGRKSKEEMNEQLFNKVIEQIKIMINESRQQNGYFNKAKLKERLLALKISDKQAEWALYQLKKQKILIVTEVFNKKLNKNINTWGLVEVITKYQEQEKKDQQLFDQILEQVNLLIQENLQKRSKNDYSNKKDLLTKLTTLGIDKKQAEWAIDQLRDRGLLVVEEVPGKEAGKPFYRWRVKNTQDADESVSSIEPAKVIDEQSLVIEQEAEPVSLDFSGDQDKNEDNNLPGSDDTQQLENIIDSERRDQIPEEAPEVVSGEDEVAKQQRAERLVKYQEFTELPAVQEFFNNLNWQDLQDPKNLQEKLKSIFDNQMAEKINYTVIPTEELIERYLDQIYNSSLLYLQQQVAQQQNKKSYWQKMISGEGKKFGKGVMGGAIYTALRVGLTHAASAITTVTMPVSLVVGGMAGGLNAILNDGLRKAGQKDQAQKVTDLLKQLDNKEQIWPDLQEQITVGLGEMYLYDKKLVADTGDMIYFNTFDEYQTFLSNRLADDESFNQELYKIRTDEDGSEKYSKAIENMVKLANLTLNLARKPGKSKKEQNLFDTSIQDRQELIKEMMDSGELAIYLEYRMDKIFNQMKLDLAGYSSTERATMENRMMLEAQIMVESEMNSLLGDVVGQEKMNRSKDQEGLMANFQNSYLAKLWQDADRYQSLGMVKKFASGFSSGAVAGLVYSNVYAGAIYGFVNKMKGTLRGELSRLNKKEIVKTASEIHRELQQTASDLDIYDDTTHQQMKDLITEAKARIKLPDIQEHERILLENDIEILRKKLTYSKALSQLAEENEFSIDQLAQAIVSNRTEQEKLAQELLQKNKKAGELPALMRKFWSLSRSSKAQLLAKAGIEGAKGGAAFALGAGLINLAGGATGFGPQTNIEQVINSTINGATLGLKGAVETVTQEIQHTTMQQQETKTTEENKTQEKVVYDNQQVSEQATANHTQTTAEQHNNQSVSNQEKQESQNTKPHDQEVTLSIGRDGDYQYGDHGFRHLMVEAAPKEIYQDGVVDAKDAAYLEYMLAVTRELAQGHQVAGFDPKTIQEFVTFDGKEIHISNYQKFESFVQGDLFARAEKVITDRSDVYAYVDDTSQKVWHSAFAEKGPNIVVEDFSKDKRVIAAEERIAQNNEVIKDYQQHFSNVPHQGNIEVKSVDNGEEVKIANNDEVYTFGVVGGKITSFNGQELPEPISHTEDLTSAVNHNMLQANSVPETKIETYQVAAEKIGIIDQKHVFVDQGDAKLLTFIEQTTNFNETQIKPYQQEEIRHLAKDIITDDGEKVLNYVDRVSDHFRDPKTVEAFSNSDLREFGVHQSAELDAAIKNNVVAEKTQAGVLLDLDQRAGDSKIVGSIIDTNKESLYLMLENPDLQLSEVEAIQKQEAVIMDKLNLADTQVHQQTLYNLRQADIRTEATASGEIKINIPSDKESSDLIPKGATLLMEKVDGELILHLEVSGNKWLGKEQTATVVQNDFWQNASENSIIQQYHSLVDKEVTQNKMASELEMARQDQGFFSFLTKDLDARYDRGFDNLHAKDVLVNQSSFVTSMLEYGQAQKLPVSGQEDNLEEQYQIIHKYLVGGEDQKINENMGKYFEQHPPHGDESIRHYLGRTVGEITTGVLPKLNQEDSKSEIKSGDLPEINKAPKGELPNLDKNSAVLEKEQSPEIIPNINTKIEQVAIPDIKFDAQEVSMAKILSNDEATLRNLVFSENRPFFDNNQTAFSPEHHDLGTDLDKIYWDEKLSNEQKVIAFQNIQSYLNTESARYRAQTLEHYKNSESQQASIDSNKASGTHLYSQSIQDNLDIINKRIEKLSQKK